VIALAASSARCVVALTVDGQICICRFGTREPTVIDGLPGAHQLKVVRRNEPVFAVCSGCRVLWGDEFEQTIFEFQSEVQHIDLGSNLCIATQNQLIIVDEGQAKFTLNLSSPINGVCRRRGQIMFWRKNVLSLVDSTSEPVEVCFNFQVIRCLVVSGSHFIGVCGKTEVVVLDDRNPTTPYSRIMVESTSFKAAWLGETEVMAIVNINELLLFDHTGRELQRYTHTRGKIVDLQAVEDAVIIQLCREVSLFQINTRPVVLEIDLKKN
jgi:hypothetical protein